MKPEMPIDNYNWKNKRILIVEDDKPSHIFMQFLLSITEAEVVIAETGQEAIDIFRNDMNFDLVLMDIQLPDINGFDVTRVLKAINNVPVIAQTAYAMYGDEAKCLMAGCDDYVAKPIEAFDLLSKMDKLLSKAGIV
jgi:two-component system, cell cycle response regulator DivK